jgi:hypothetical protein
VHIYIYIYTEEKRREKSRERGEIEIERERFEYEGLIGNDFCVAESEKYTLANLTTSFEICQERKRREKREIKKGEEIERD